MTLQGQPLVSALLEVRHHGGSSRPFYDHVYRHGGPGNLRGHHRWLLEAMDARPGQRLLDVACGEAGLVIAAHAWGLDAQGIDQSAVALRHARAQLPPTRLIVADGEALPYADAAFDRVVNVGSLEHYLDPLRGAAEMARVLAPDGLAVILLPNLFGLRTTVLRAWRSGEVYDDGQPLQRYGTRRQWTRLLEAAGFRVVRTLGYESHGELPSRPTELAGLARHPSRLLVPLSPWLPVDLAALLVFLCRKG